MGRATVPSTEPKAPLPTELVACADLHLFHKNPHKGNVGKIMESLAEPTGQYRAIVVNRGTLTGRPAEVLAGNHTLMAARRLGWAQISVSWVDVDDVAAAKIVAGDNRNAQLGTDDPRLLAELLGGLPSLVGTGYGNDDLDDLLVSLERAAPPGEQAPDGVISVGPEQTNESQAGVNKYSDEQHNNWANSGRRIISLDMPVGQFVWAQEKLQQLGGEFEVDSNTAVVLRLIADATEEPVPLAPVHTPTPLPAEAL